MIEDHVYKDMWQSTSANHVYKDMSHTTLVDHNNKGNVAEHVNKYTWHNQMMKSLKRTLAHAISVSDVSELCHSGRISSGVSPPRNLKSPKVLKDKDSKSLLSVDLTYPSDTILTIRSRR